LLLEQKKCGINSIYLEEPAGDLTLFGIIALVCQFLEQEEELGKVLIKEFLSFRVLVVLQQGLDLFLCLLFKNSAQVQYMIMLCFCKFLL
jgi:hypothetical protein